MIGASPDESIARRSQLLGSMAAEIDSLRSTEDVLENALEMVKAKQFVEPGDVVVLTAGLPAPMGTGPTPVTVGAI
ncbi:MAG: pyruvate kinase alpha/beta domain-containing protein [Sellimonas intestinalis]